MTRTLILCVTLLGTASGADDPVPPPRPVETDVHVGVYIFPGWYRDAGTTDYDYRTHSEDSEWRQIAQFAMGRPLLGFYDDSLPEVNDWHIKWALEAGISWFAFDWYWNAGEKRLERSLERGFLKARYNEMMQFCIHWCNHGLDWKNPLDFSPQALEETVAYCVNNYFKRPNYMKIDDRPVLMIWDIKTILKQNGGDESFRTHVLPRLNAICRRAGLKDLFIILADNAPVRLAGIGVGDAVTGYSYAALTTDSPFTQPGSAPYSEMVEAIPDYWRTIQRDVALPFLISTQAGWDNTTRAMQHGGGKSRWVRTGNTPELVERTLRDGKALMPPGLPLFLIEAWNEWGEGSFVEPGKQYGFGQLEAIRRVFAPRAPAPRWDMPTAAQIDSYSVLKGEELARARARETEPDPSSPSPDDVLRVTIDPERLPDVPTAHVPFDSEPALTRLKLSSGVQKVGLRDGRGVFRVTGGDPFILMEGQWGPLSRIGSIAVRLRLPEGGRGRGQIFWKTTVQALSEEHSRRFHAPFDGRWHTVLFEFGPEYLRLGDLVAFRLDLPDSLGTGGEAEIESVRFYKGTSALRQLFESGLMWGGMPAKRVSVSVRGARDLHLIVDNGGDDGSWDHADWADARLIAADGTIVYLDELRPVSAVQGHGKLALAKNLEGRPLSIADRRFEHGLGTTHDSKIVYSLNGRYDRFQAWVGLDSIVRNHGTVAFHVLVTQPTNGTGKDGIAPNEKGKAPMRDAAGEEREPEANLLVHRFLPVRPLSRAGRLTEIAAEVENLGDVDMEAQARLVLPETVRLTEGRPEAPLRVPGRETRPVSWVIESSEAGECRLRLELRAGDAVVESVPLTMQFLPPYEARRLPYIPEPKPVHTDYLVGAHHCPLWEDNAASFPRRQNVLRHPERTPALGFYDQANPEVADWETTWASEHGIDFFIYCWYRTSQGRPVETMLSSAIHDALFKSRFVDHMKFTIMWENQHRGRAGVEDMEDLRTYLFPFWMQNFFKHASYLKVDNKPVLFIYRPEFLVDDLGGEENVVKAFEWMRQACREEGFAGLTILGEYRGLSPDHLQLMKRLGLDYTFAYCWHMPKGNPTHEEVIAKQMEYIRGTQDLNILPQVVTVSQAWSGWHDEGVIWKLPPAELEDLMRQAKAFTATLPPEQLGSKMLLLDNWNEWGEGHYIAPYREYGFGYLDAVRRVFSDAPEAHQDLFPEDIGMGPYDTAYTTYAERERELRNLLTRKVYKPGAPQDGLVGWWAFDEDGPVTLDYSGNRLGGILRGAPPRAGGIDGKALVCQGGAVEIPNAPALSPLDALTLECWVKTDVAGQHDRWFINRVLSGGVATGYAMGVSEGRPRFGIPLTDWSHYLNADMELPTGRWVHLAGTYDGHTMRLYVDGEERGHMERRGRPNPNNFSLFLGNFTAGHKAHFVGLLDEVKLYGRALGPEEVRQHARRNQAGR